MTVFLCVNGHRFNRPQIQAYAHGRPHPDAPDYTCPTCETGQFRVVALGGDVAPAGACEGACTL